MRDIQDGVINTIICSRFGQWGIERATQVARTKQRKDEEEQQQQRQRQKSTAVEQSSTCDKIDPRTTNEAQTTVTPATTPTFARSKAATNYPTSPASKREIGSSGGASAATLLYRELVYNPSEDRAFASLLMQEDTNQFMPNSSNSQMTESNGSTKTTTMDDATTATSMPHHGVHHIAVVMDGNRRYGKKHFNNSLLGHSAGADQLIRFIRWCLRAQHIKILTVYAFSTENWKRSDTELAALMSLFISHFQKIRAEAATLGLRVRFLTTNPTLLPTDVLEQMACVEWETRRNANIILNVCVSYGSRSALTCATNRLLRLDELKKQQAQQRQPLHEMLLTTTTTTTQPNATTRLSDDDPISSLASSGRSSFITAPPTSLCKRVSDRNNNCARCTLLKGASDEDEHDEHEYEDQFEVTEEALRRELCRSLTELPDFRSSEMMQQIIASQRRADKEKKNAEQRTSAPTTKTACYGTAAAATHDDDNETTDVYDPFTIGDNRIAQVPLWEIPREDGGAKEDMGCWCACSSNNNKLVLTSLALDPDVFLRTSTEVRLSNFLLFESAYSELFFCRDRLWPELTADDFCNVLTDFSHKRSRRFGK